MPYSFREGKREIAAYLKSRFGRGEGLTILDVGPGEGTYEKLLRPALPEAEFVCLEIFEPYCDAYGLRSRYDRVLIGDVRDFALDFAPGVVVFGDVLEHMRREEALAVLSAYCAKARAVVVSIPIIHIEQGAVGGNVYETHLQHWTHRSFLADAAGAGVRARLRLRGRNQGVYIFTDEEPGLGIRIYWACSRCVHAAGAAYKDFRRRVRTVRKRWKGWLRRAWQGSR